MSFNITQEKRFSDPEKAIDYALLLYQTEVNKIKDIFFKFLKGSSQSLEKSMGFYPFIGFHVEADKFAQANFSNYGAFFEPGFYGTTITRPDIFYNYYKEQIGLLINRYKVEAFVGLSDHPIPLPFIISHHSTIGLTEEQALIFRSHVVLPNLSRLNDSIPNAEYIQKPGDLKPLSLFTGERVDFSLHRLAHYTGTLSEHFQSFILLTNYQRYIDEFIKDSKEQLKEDNGYEALIGPGNKIIASRESFVEEDINQRHLPQMPAYHLKRKDGKGITFINIGVGPSNAKTITDHLSVLRSDCWLMLGHCAGLRASQMLGDYVLAHAYVRDDHVLDQDLPHWVPLPALAEIQIALQSAVKNITKETEPELKARFRTGTLITTDNRNWELRSNDLYQKFKQTRAIAVDMESATVAANGFRFRVPYGTLLCVSDKPIEGEIKLQGMATSFYKQRVHKHLKVGLEAVRILREGGSDILHSRKLRGFDDPPFR